MIGNAGVGKTCMVQRIMNKPLPDYSLPTISVEFNNRIFELPNGKKLNVELWDTGKHSSFDFRQQNMSNDSWK